MSDAASRNKKWREARHGQVAVPEANMVDAVREVLARQGGGETMSGTMLDKVAAAIADAQARGYHGPQVLARAAVTAMREPTPVMMRAAEADDDWETGFASAGTHWEAMIAAALKEETKP